MNLGGGNISRSSQFDEGIYTSVSISTDEMPRAYIDKEGDEFCLDLRMGVDEDCFRELASEVRSGNYPTYISITLEENPYFRSLFSSGDLFKTGGSLSNRY